MSLFDTFMDGPSDEMKAVEQDSTPDASENPTNGEEPAWWWDDATPGTGERPEWLPEKYFKASDVAKAYTELNKKFTAPPDKYDFSAGESWLEPEFEAIQEFAEFARSKRVPQDVVDKMLSSVGKYLDEFKVDFAEERTLLGADAEERLQVLNNWMKSNFSEDSYYALTKNLTTADSIKAIEEMRKKMIDNHTTIPTGNELVGEAPLTVEDIQLEMADNMERYTKDAKYRAEITRKIEVAVQNEKK